MAKILLLNGPNLNLLGTREPDVYGAETLQDIEALLHKQATSNKHQLSHFQSNSFFAYLLHPSAPNSPHLLMLLVNKQGIRLETCVPTT